MKYKVGDKVKLIKDGFGGHSKFKVGDTFIIEEIIDDYLRHTKGEGTGVHNTYCELVEEDKQESKEEPDQFNGFVKYKNGTRCKIIGNHNCHNKKIGSIITITEFTGYLVSVNGFAYKDNGSTDSTVLRSIDLEEVKEEVSTFKVGEYVEIIGPLHCYSNSPIQAAKMGATNYKIDSQLDEGDIVKISAIDTEWKSGRIVCLLTSEDGTQRVYDDKGFIKSDKVKYKSLEGIQGSKADFAIIDEAAGYNSLMKEAQKDFADAFEYSLQNILYTNTKPTMSTLSKIQTEEFFSNKKNVKAIEETISELKRLEESFERVREDLYTKINRVNSLRTRLNSAVSNDDIKSIQEQLVVLKPRVEFLNRYEENTIKELGFTETKVTSPEDFFKS